MSGAGIPTEALLGLAGVPLILALTEATKRVLPALAPRWFPVVALGWALAINLGLGWYRGLDPVAGLVLGTVAGLAASGLYSGARVASRGG